MELHSMEFSEVAINGYILDKICCKKRFFNKPKHIYIILFFLFIYL